VAHLTSHQIIILFTSLALLLGFALVFGELARMLKQPAVVGETLAGILLGPSVLGAVSPDTFLLLFPQTGPGAIALDSLVAIAVVLLLLVAGLEMNLDAMYDHGGKALTVSLLGIIVPFAIGGASAYFWPELLGMGAKADRLTFALFFATALSISALPVIAKTLMDLDLLRTELGVLVITSAMVNDLIGWVIFSVVLGMMGAAGHGGGSVWTTIGWTLGVMAFMFVVLRPLVHKILPWVQSRLVYPGGVMGFTLILAFAASALTEFIGVHAVFGAFLVGIVVGDSPRLRQRTREIINNFISHIFAPIFFAAIGLYANVIADFNLTLVLLVLALAIAGKVIGGYAGARLGGMTSRHSLAVGFGLNARGAMGIIMALLAVQYDVITTEAFVALVIMALLTSVLSGPVMDHLMQRRKRWTLRDASDARCYVPELKSEDVRSAIHELAEIAAKKLNLSADKIVREIMLREQMGATAISHGIAIPHARMKGLIEPLVVIGRSHAGLPCRESDCEPIRLVFLLLTPRDEALIQLEMLGDIAAHFRKEETRAAALKALTFNELMAELVVSHNQRPENGHAGQPSTTT
jgi:Kef-type K+ transport system membrane component KefB/mannitol/fructose-specific phosphotransferase system IIA component (Ntr-type)